MTRNPDGGLRHGRVGVPSPPLTLEGDLCIPDGAGALVIFAHGSGRTRTGRRDGALSEALVSRGLATLRFDLLTDREAEADRSARLIRFDPSLLAGRLVDAIDWVSSASDPRRWRIGLMGSSIGATAALIAAARRPDAVEAVVSRGGRPDLAVQILGQVVSPTLLIVGEEDGVTLEHNRRAEPQIAATDKRLHVVPGAGHRFDEPGSLQTVVRAAVDWFDRYLCR